MSKQLLKQLDKLQFATIDSYDEKSRKYIFKKANSVRVEENHCYLLELDKSFLNESSFEVLSYNLNKGTYPKSSKLRADVIKVLNKMINVNALELDSNTFWSGWLPLQSIKVLEEI